MRPDPELGAKIEQQEQQRLTAINKTLTDNDKQQLVDQAKQLQQDQEGNEDLSCLPTLQLSDIGTTEPEVISLSVELIGQTVMLYPQPTNGLGYINLYFSCDHLDESLRPYLPLFSSMLTQVGAGDASYIEMAQRIEAGTGGINSSVEILDDIDNLDSFQPLLRLRGKALMRNMDKLSGILADLCSSANFSDQERLATVIGQIKSSWENAIPGSGHSYAARAAAGHLTPAGNRREQWSGFTQLKLIKQVAELGADQLGEIVQIMQKIAEAIIDRNHVNAAITAEKAQLPAAQAAMAALLEQIPQRSTVATQQAVTAVNPSAVQLGWITSIPVSYVTQVFRTVPFNHPDSAALKILAALLKANFLHREIREKGGAYGGMANSCSESGVFSLLSYRDPQLLRTLDVYQQALAWVQEGDFDEEKIKEAVLAVFSAHDRPLSPSGRGSNEFANQQQGMTHSIRQQFRNRLLAVTKEQLLDVAKRYLSDHLDQSPISILSNDEALQAASEALAQLQIERL